MAVWESRKILCEEAEVIAIANAIREKNDITRTMSISEMPNLIKGDTCLVYFDVNTQGYPSSWWYTDENGNRLQMDKGSGFGGQLSVLQGTSLICSIKASSYDMFNIVSSHYNELAREKVYEWYIPYGLKNLNIYMLYSDCCFAPGTQILISLDGKTKNIESLQKGDEIVAYNIKTKENYLATVKKLIINRNTTDIAEITFENGTQLKMNAYHPIYTKNGFHSLTNHNNYDTLVIGDEVKRIK